MDDFVPPRYETPCFRGSIVPPRDTFLDMPSVRAFLRCVFRAPARIAARRIGARHDEEHERHLQQQRADGRPARIRRGDGNAAHALARVAAARARARTRHRGRGRLPGRREGDVPGAGKAPTLELLATDPSGDCHVLGSLVTSTDRCNEGRAPGKPWALVSSHGAKPQAFGRLLPGSHSSRVRHASVTRPSRVTSRTLGRAEPTRRKPSGFPVGSGWVSKTLSKPFAKALRSPFDAASDRACATHMRPRSSAPDFCARSRCACTRSNGIRVVVHHGERTNEPASHPRTTRRARHEMRAILSAAKARNARSRPSSKPASTS